MSRYDRAMTATGEDDALIDALVQTSFITIAIVSATAARHDLSLTQLRVLAILRDHTPTMSELADHLGLDRSTVTGLIDRATDRSLVRRVENDADRRSSRVTLTTAGRKLAARGGTEISGQLRPHVENLTPADRGHLTRLLEQVIGSA